MNILDYFALAASPVVLFSIIAFLSRNWFIEKLKLSLQKEHSKFLDQIQWERKIGERAEKVAEYLAIARQLNGTSPETDYIKANQLSWELAMWLPEDIYKNVTKAISHPALECNPLTAVINVRKLLLMELSGNLSSDDIAHHAPGIGIN